MTSLAGVSLREAGAIDKGFRTDLFDVGLKYAADKPHGWIKAFYVFSEFFGHLGLLPQDNPSLNAACKGAKLIKLTHSPIDFFTAVHETREVTADWMEGKKDKRGELVGVPQIVRKANNLIAPVREMWELLVKTAYIPNSAVFETFKGLSGFSLIFGMGWNVIDDVEKGKKAKKADKLYELSGHLMSLVKNISYVALGVITVLATFFQFVFAPLTICAISTTSVVFTILGYYHKELGQPKKLN